MEEVKCIKQVSIDVEDLGITSQVSGFKYDEKRNICILVFTNGRILLIE
jgi:hypothetical protein